MIFLHFFFSFLILKPVYVSHGARRDTEEEEKLLIDNEKSLKGTAVSLA